MCHIIPQGWPNRKLRSCCATVSNTSFWTCLGCDGRLYSFYLLLHAFDVDLRNGLKDGAQIYRSHCVSLCHHIFSNCADFLYDDIFVCPEGVDLLQYRCKVQLLLQCFYALKDWLKVPCSKTNLPNFFKQLLMPS